ncbi:MAG TPA: hypothetical protein VH369_16310 [Bryobacteraceae bacterium]
MKRSVRILWMVLILTDIVASLLPSDSPPIRTLDQLVNDKLEHMAMYAAIAVLPVIYERRRIIILVSAGAVALGVVLEYVQRFTGWRDFEYGDMVASAAGVCVGLIAGIFLRVVLRWFSRKHEAQDRFTRDGLAAQARGLKLP